MENLINEIVMTVISGLIFTLILFLIKEHILPKKNITGEWKSTITINESSYNSYVNLGIEFRIHLLQKGNDIIGSGEKIKDLNIDGTETVFERSKRVSIEISGNYEKSYLKRSKVYFNIIEKGTLRDSRSTYILVVKNSRLLKGTFKSTVADSSGKIVMNKL
jgi:hypothetical protein